MRPTVNDSLRVSILVMIIGLIPCGLYVLGIVYPPLILGNFIYNYSYFILQSMCLHPLFAASIFSIYSIAIYCLTNEQDNKGTYFSIWWFVSYMILCPVFGHILVDIFPTFLTTLLIHQGWVVSGLNLWTVGLFYFSFFELFLGSAVPLIMLNENEDLDAWWDQLGQHPQQEHTIKDILGIQALRLIVGISNIPMIFISPLQYSINVVEPLTSAACFTYQKMTCEKENMKWTDNTLGNTGRDKQPI